MAGRSIVIQDRVKDVLDSVRALTKQKVLVGIPETTDARDDGEINNATLAYIHELGAPGANIPARPFLVPGVRKSIRETTPHLRQACEAALDGKPEKAQRSLVRAGVVAENYAKREISTGDFVPLKPGTIAARFRSRNTQSQRQSEKQYLQLIGQGASPAGAQVAVGIHPLINTGVLRNSITSVVRQAK